MKDLLVDPYMISARKHMTQDEASSFVECAVIWMGAERRTGCRLVISDGYLYALWKADQYPTPDKLRSICRIAHNESFDAETVLRAFDQILTIAPRIEKITSIGEVLIDEDKTNIVPSTTVKRLSPKVIDALADTLATCGLYTTMTGVNYPLGFATDSSPVDSKHDIECEFLVLDFNESSQSTISLPLAVTLKLPLLANNDDVLGILDFDSVCHDAECAIQWSRVHAIRRQDRAGQLTHKFIIREEFKEKIVSLSLPTSMLKQVYRKVTYLLCGLRSAGLEVEPLRIGQGPNSAQIRRATDGAEAFRMQISQYGAGYHVHYWSCSGGLIEIAWIGPHNDYFIPE